MQSGVSRPLRQTKAAAHAAAFFMGIALTFVNARDACEKLK